MMNDRRKLSEEEIKEEVLKEANRAVEQAFIQIHYFYKILATKPKIHEAMLNIYIIGRTMGLDHASDILEEALRLQPDKKDPEQIMSYFRNRL